MNIPPASAPLWIRVWIAIGLGAFLFFLFLPTMISRVRWQEIQRFQACKMNQRLDCRSSVIWMIEGLKLEN